MKSEALQVYLGSSMLGTSSSLRSEEDLYAGSPKPSYFSGGRRHSTDLREGKEEETEEEEEEEEEEGGEDQR